MVLVVHGIQQALSAAKEPLINAVAHRFSLPPECIKSVDVVRRSVDARKRRSQREKIDIRLVYNLHVTMADETTERAILAKFPDAARLLEHHEPYQPTMYSDDHPMFHTMPGCRRPLVVGSGPAGLFAAHTLALSGFRPVVIEMGPKVERRATDLMNFWKNNMLTPNSNGVFGEGGAGAFSDGKLTTRTSSPYHRFVHEALIKCGAKPNILYESRAHVGTDELRKIITNFSRNEIIANGGTFLYNTKLNELILKNGAVSQVMVDRMVLANPEEEIDFLSSYQDLVDSGVVVVPSATAVTAVSEVPKRFALNSTALFLGTGHSSRSVYEHLHAAGVSLSKKDFAVGLRLQISQKYINKMQFGDEARNPLLGAAEFTLKHHDKDTDRNVYTFCMCPGGVIVNASHGGDEVAVNGMSYSTRGSKYANSAFVVPVGGEDFDAHASKGEEALGGMRFQQFWEKKCFEEGGGSYAAPAQRVVDYVNRTDSKGRELPDHKFMGNLVSGNLHAVLPDYVNKPIVTALKHFSKHMPGIISDDTLLVGIESRTSAPVRIDRDQHTLESLNVRGLYPIGEGAGYAGGIMTACVDGVRAAEAMIASRIRDLS